MTPVRIERLLFGLFAAMASSWRHYADLSRPFGLDLEGVMGGRFQAAFVKAWQVEGFFELGGRPLLTPLPGLQVQGEIYANHPPLYHWISYAFTRIFGAEEFGLRLYPAICCALLGFMLIDWIRERASRAGALVALTIFLTAPMIRIYGTMANYECALILFSFAAYRILPGGQSKIGIGRGLIAALLMFLAVGQDWPALFSLPAIFFILLVDRRPVVKPMLWLGLGAVAALAGYFLLLAFWLDGFGAAIRGLRAALQAGQSSKAWDWAMLGSAQLKHLHLGYGWGVLVALGAALGAALTAPPGSTRRNARAALAWCIAAICYLAAFPARAIDHEFCWFYPVAGILLAAALLTDLIVGAIKRRPLAAAMTLVLAAAFAGGALEARQSRPDKRMPPVFFELINQTNVALGTDTLLLTPRIYSSAWFYFEPWIAEGVTNPADVERTIAFLRAGQLGVRRVAVELMTPLDKTLDPTLLAREKGREINLFGTPIWIFEP